MSLFEKFFIVFESDAGELASDMDEVQKKTKDFAKAAQDAGRVDFNKVETLPIALAEAEKQADKVAKSASKIGTETDKATKKMSFFQRSLAESDKKMRSMGSSIANTITGIAAPIFALVSVTAMVSSAFSRIGEVESLGKAAAQSRIAVGDLDALGRAARDLGGDVQSASNDIKNLADKAIEGAADRSSGAAKVFASMGVKLKNNKKELKDTNQLLLDLAGATEKMSAVKATDKLKKLGITDPGMVKLILAGKKAVLEHVEAQKKVGVVTEEQVEATRKYRIAQNEFKDATTVASTSLMTAFLPALTQGIKWLTLFIGWCQQNKTFVSIFFGALSAAVAGYTLYATAAAIATNAFLWPVLAVIAACAAFALVLEDILAYMSGQPSLLGDLASKYPAVANALRMIGEVWNFVKQQAGIAFEFLKNIWGMITALWNGDIDAFKEHFLSALNHLKEFWGNMWEGFKGIVGKVVDWIKIELLKMIPDWAKRWLGMTDSDKAEAQKSIEEEDRAKEVEKQKATNAAIEAGKTGIENTKVTPIPANNNQKIDVRNDTSVNVASPNIVINATDTAAGAAAAAQGMGNNLQREYSKVISNAADGVQR